MRCDGDLDSKGEVKGWGTVNTEGLEVDEVGEGDCEEGGLSHRPRALEEILVRPRDEVFEFEL